MEEYIGNATIEDLPDHILEKIFLFLSPKGVKIAALVTKRWSEVIAQSTDVMKRYQLNLEESEGVIKKALDLKRKFQSAKIKNLIPAVKNVLHMHNLRSLTISCCTLDLPSLVSALKGLIVLEELHTVGVNIIDENSDGIEQVQMRRLTSLQLHLSDPIMVDIFDVTSLRKFQASYYMKYECENIIKLIEKQQNLKEFSIGGTLCTNFFSSPLILKVPFKLTSLEIVGSSVNRGEELPFLKSHADTIERLFLEHPLIATTFNFIMKSMPKLKDLKIATKLITNEYFNNLTPNLQVKNLTLLGSLRYNQSGKNIINLLPSVERLDLSNILTSALNPDCLHYISRELKELKSLKMSSFFCEQSAPYPIFPKLREFSISKIYHEKHYENFIRDHSEILEKITIKFVEDKKFVKGLTVDKIMGCKNLKQVVIGSESPLVVRMFNKKVNRPQPWTLEARIKSKLDDDHIALKFNFPDDLPIWEERYRVYDDELIRDFTTLESYGTNAFVNKYK